MSDLPVIVTSSQSFDTLLTQCARTKKLLLVDFHADWCAPCRAIAPYFVQLCQQYNTRGVVFAKVIADQCKVLCQQEFVTRLPTFKFYLNAECVATLIGGDPIRLQALLDKYSLQPSVLQLMSCPDSRLKSESCAELIHIIENVLCLEQSSRSLDTEKDRLNPYISVPGFSECLFAVGFERQPEGSFCLSTKSTDKEKARLLLDQLKSLSTLDKSVQKLHPLPQSTTQSPPLARAALTAQDLIDPLYEKLMSSRSLVATYADPEAQAMADSLIPTDRLVDEAATKYHCAPSDVNPWMFLHQLLRWFKQEFFRWAGEFQCETCGSKMQCCGQVQPTATERHDLAFNVELYKCCVNPSHPPYRFPRFNDPRALLHTRLGRCGEWANCFALCLVSVRRPITAGGEPWFPACRYVLDWTDHVWCEVWLEDEHSSGHYRWVHCDPGGEVDQPLLYECGWGKKLTYVIAYTIPPSVVQWDSHQAILAVDVQDVTWRYTRQFAEVVSRRDRTKEADLSRYLMHFHMEAKAVWSRLQNALSTLMNGNHPFSIGRTLLELASFLTPPRDPDHRLPGRKTGPLEWRRARGELGADDPELQPDLPWEGKNVILEPNESELQQGMFYLRYNCALDIYQRPFASPSPTTNRSASDTREDLVQQASDGGLKGWQSVAARWRNIDRKVEHDWHMVYMAREEDSPAEHEGSIEWHFRVNRDDYEIGRISLFANMVCFSEDSGAHLTVCSECETTTPCIASQELTGVCVRLEPGSTTLFNLTDFCGAKHLCLRGRLWTETTEGTVSADRMTWQKAQLFRQKDNDWGIWSLEWKVELIQKQPQPHSD